MKRKSRWGQRQRLHIRKRKGSLHQFSIGNVQIVDQQDVLLQEEEWWRRARREQKRDRERERGEYASQIGWLEPAVAEAPIQPIHSWSKRRWIMNHCELCWWRRGTEKQGEEDKKKKNVHSWGKYEARAQYGINSKEERPVQPIHNWSNLASIIVGYVDGEAVTEKEGEEEKKNGEKMKAECNSNEKEPIQPIHNWSKKASMSKSRWDVLMEKRYWRREEGRGEDEGRVGPIQIDVSWSLQAQNVHMKIRRR